MTALLILLTPVLLLGIVALFAFVGCFSEPCAPPTPAVETAGPGTSTLSTTVSNLCGGELLVATVQWGGPTQSPSLVADSGAPLNPAPEVDGGNAFDWNGMKIQVFTLVNSSQKSSVTITALLSAPSPDTWSLCVWPYPTSTPTLYGAVKSNPNGTGTNVAAPAINVMNKGDAVYAVAYAADPGAIGKFPSNNSLSAGPGFTAASTTVPDPLLESSYATASGPVTATAMNTTGSSNSKAFIFAVAVRIK
jgi:hypothetical protein